ncbi:MAG: hypothetical protein OIF32_05110 [Campylobacterales bacterium]|nr:hypothetical protein [Campylobacterales bacterium]
MKKLLILIGVTSYLFSHTPLLTCIDEGDGTVTCEGGFSGGSSAGGVKFRVEQGKKVVVESKFNSSSEVTFKKPKGEYKAVFDAGEGHVIYLDSKNIFE